MKKIILFLIIFFLPCVAFCQLYLSQVTKTNNKYEISFNKSIKFFNVEYKNNLLTFPKYNNKYKQVAIINKKFKAKLIKDFVDKTVKDDKNDVKFSIGKMEKLKNHKTIKAFASVIFENSLEVQCRIMRGKHGLWVAWPSNKYKDVWQKEFVFSDKKLKRKVEDMLVDKYNSISCKNSNTYWI